MLSKILSIEQKDEVFIVRSELKTKEIQNAALQESLQPKVNPNIGGGGAN